MKGIKEMEKKKPRQAVVMFIYNDKDEVLFTKRSLTRKLHPGIWALPAGHIEEGEDFKNAAIREAGEELDIKVTDANFIEKIKEPSGDNADIYLVNIPVESYGGIPTINTDEFEAIVWMKIGNFYDRYGDTEIGPTLRHLRAKFQTS